MGTPLSPVRSDSRFGFTLVELMVAMAVMALLVLMMHQLFSGATTITTTGNKQIDVETQARPIFDRMQIDFSQMVKRTDVDYYFKQPSNPQAGNDQIAFYSEVSGFSSGSPGSVSLVSYRINSSVGTRLSNKLERMAKGLLWNGAATGTPVVFLPLTINATWATATSSSTTDVDYDLLGPQVFRFEYWYLLRDGSRSVTPWIGSGGIAGLRDVAAIGVALAVIDPKSKVIVSDSQLTTLATAMKDFNAADAPGVLEAQWQTMVNTSALPRSSSSAIKIYRRYFYLPNQRPST